MALVTAPIANYLSGISQQPSSMRTATSLEVCRNGWASVVNGLQKRAPTEHLANLGAMNGTGSMVGHIIDRDSGYRYLVLIQNGALKVFDLDGVEQTVNFPDGNSYLQAASPINAFRFLTFADTTFVMNRDITVTADEFGEDVLADYTPDGTVATLAELPTAEAANEGDVYYVTGASKYYQCTKHIAVPEQRAWNFVSSAQYNVPLPTPNGALPSPPTAAGTYWYRATVNYVQNGAIYKADMERYVSVVTSPASGITYSFDPVALADVVSDAGNDRLNPKSRATIAVLQSVANSNYTVYKNNTLVATLLTKNGTSATESVQSTTVIATTLGTTLATAGVANTVIGSTIAITGLLASDTITVTSTNGDKTMRSYRDSVASFSDLPPRDVIGRIVKVRGAADENGDDYHVIHDGENNWRETFGYGHGARLSSLTMPHVLVREVDGTWTFKRHTWTDRGAGDSTSNIHPSFVGEKLADMCLFSGRLGFVTGTNVILSESDRFENFYRTTLATLVDSDRLDFSVLSSTNDTLCHAIPFNKDILIVGTRSQYRFSYTNFLGPKQVQIQFTTSYTVSPSVRPVNMGASVYLADDNDAYTYGQVLEYFPRPNAQGDDADIVTAPVPQLIRSGVRFIAGSPRVNCMIVGTDGSPASLKLYKYYWAADKKIQNAWSDWTFEDCIKVHFALFNQNYLYLAIERASGVCLERIKMDEDTFDLTTGSAVLLDRRVAKADLTISYSQNTNLTTITLPYTTTSPIQVVTKDGTGQIWQPTTPVNGSTVTVPGDVSGDDVTAGIGYALHMEISPLYLRFTKGSGEIINMDGRMQVRRMTLTFSHTRYFKSVITLPGRTDDTKVFDMPTQNGSVNIPIMARNLDAKLRIVNDSPFASAFSGGEFQALYGPKAPRMKGS